MKKRILSLFLVFALCLTLMPSAVFAEAEPNAGESLTVGAAVGQNAGGSAVAKVGDTEYETLQDVLEEMSEAEITLLQNVKEDITVYAATIIHMNGFSITGNIDVTDSLTLTGGIVDGTVNVDGGVFNMTAPSDAEAAITKGLNVVSGSAYVSGAQIGVKFSLYFDGDELIISGSEQAVSLTDSAKPDNLTLYGATSVDQDATLSVEFDGSTYATYGSIAKKISNKQGGSQPPAPVPVTIELTPETAEIYGGQSAEFTVSYNGTDALKAYIQKNAQDDTIDATYDADTGIVTVTTTEEVKAGIYTLYVHELNDPLISASADITVKNAVAKDSDGKYYGDIKTAVEGVADGSTITVVAKEKQISLPDEIYVETADKGITLDLNGHSLGGYSLNVGGLTATRKVRTGKLTVIDSKGGSGAVGVAVRNGGTFIFAPDNVNTTLLQLQVYGGTVELRGGNITAGKWELYNGVKLSELIPSDKGYAYRLYYGGNLYSSWVTLSEAQNNTASKDKALAVVQCEHEGADENNNCLYCGTALAAKNGSKYYTSFEAAIAAANENDTVTLLKSVDEHCTIEKNMTIDLGGNNKINHNITIRSGSTLTLAGKGTVSVVQSGTELDGVVGGALNVLSDDVIVSTLSVNQIPNPEMNLSKGTFWKIELSDNLEGGMTVNQLLKNGYAFAYSNNEAVANGNVRRLDDVKVVAHVHDTSSGPCVCGYTCDHSNGFTDEGKCKDCGYVCPHTNVGDDGKCTVCGTAMVAKVEVGETITYASDLAYALNNAVNGTTITLLADVSNSGKRACVTGDGKTVTLNLNGKTISEGWINVGIDADGNTYTSSTLKITGSGSFTTSGSIYVGQLAKLDLSSWGGGENDTISTVAMSGRNGSDGKLLVGEKAGTINTLGFYNWRLSSISSELRGGTYGEITITISDSLISSIPYSDALAEGYALQYTDSGEYVGYTTAANCTGINTIEKVRVIKCDHNGANGFDVNDVMACPHCGAPAVAYTALKNVEGNPWRNFADLQTAIDADRNGGSVLRLLADVTGDYTIDSNVHTGLDLNGHSINGTVTVKAATGNYTTTFSNSGSTGGIEKVEAHSGAKLAGSGAPAVIGELTLADGATWENILNLKTLGYKVLNADGSYKWYAPADITDRTTLNNVIINSLPITSKSLSFNVDSKNVTSNKVERGTTVQLCAYCNTKDADVDIYVGTPAGDGTYAYSQKKAEYKKIGTMLYYVVDFEANTVGTYSIYFTASKDGYSVTSAPKTLTVTKASIPANAIAAPAGISDLIYNGSAQPLVTAGSVDAQYGTMQYSLKKSSDFSTDIPTAKDAGTYKVYYKVMGAEGYKDSTFSTPITVTIAPKELKITGVTLEPKTYDGEKTVKPRDVTFDDDVANAELKLGDYTLNVTFDSADAGTEVPFTATVKLKDSVKNYTLPNGVYHGTAAIAKADAPTNIQNGTLNVINGTKLEYTYDFKQLLPELTKGEYGTIRYNLSAVSLVQNSGYYLDHTTIELDDGVLILASLYAKDGTMTDEIGTVKVNVATDNYKSFELTLTLNAVNQIKPTADGTVTASTITYGQTLSESTISGKMKDPATGETVNGTFEWKNGTAKPNAGDYDAEWTFTPDEPEYAAVTDTATVEVNRKDIAGAKVTLKSDSFVYDGTRKIPEAESVVLDGVTLEYGEYKDYVCGYSSGANVATYEFTVIGYNNYIGNVTVTWSITAREVTPTVTVDDGEYVYDEGKEIKPNVTVKDGDTVIDPTEYDVSYSNNTNAGTGKVTVTDKDGGNYVIGTADTTFAISKADAPVDMQSGALTVTNATTQNYTYDFKQLLPAAPGGDYGAVSYTLQLPFDTPIGYAVEKLPAGSEEYTFENGVLDMNFTTPFEKNLQKTGRIGAIKVTVTTDNYKDFELTLELYAVNKIKLVPGTVNCTEITYGDKLGNSVITGVMYAEDDAAKTTPISGKFEWDSTDITPVNGDEVAYVFIPDEANKYETYTGYVNIKVNPKNIAGAKVTLKSDSFVYDGTTRIPEAESVVLDGVTLEYGTDYDCGYTNGKDVGTYEFYVTGYNNYTGRVTVKWSITTREVTPTVTVDDGEYVYDEGKEIKPNVTVKDGDTVIDPTEYDVSYSNNTNAGTGKVTVTDKDGGNYVIGTADTTFTIKPAKGGSLGTAERSQKYTYTQNFTYTPDDWSKLPKNQTFNYSSTYSVSEGSNAELTCREISDDGTLTYAISGGKAGDKVVITLRAHCGNYEDFTVTLNVTLLKRDEQAALVVKGDTTVVYGQTLTLTAEGGSGTGEVTYSIDKANSEGDATIDPATGVLTPVKVGSVSVIATKAGDKDYNDVIAAPFVITITQAESVGEPNYTKITTSGKKLKDAALTADGSTLDPNVGTLEWVDDNGNVLPDDTKVVANTIYKWRFTPADSNYTTLSGAVELYHHVPGGVFYYSYYTIKATAGDGGAVSPSGDIRVREGRDQTFTITPDEDHVIADVKIDGKSIGAVESYTFENVGKAHTIEVSFAKTGDITEADRFADIADGSYYEDAVDWAVKNGITKGTDNTHFSPNGICTRAQAVTFLWRAAGSPEPESDVMPFTDVTADSYYYNAVLWAVENGITKGTDDTVFSPDMTCSRAQIVTFLWRFEKSPSVGTVNPFTDVKSDAYYADAVLWAVSEDITNGTSDTAFSPDADCTRAQIVTFLWRCKK